MADVVWRLAGKERPKTHWSIPVHCVKILKGTSRLQETKSRRGARASRRGEKEKKRRAKKAKKACFYPLKVHSEDAMIEMVQSRRK